MDYEFLLRKIIYLENRGQGSGVREEDIHSFFVRPPGMASVVSRIPHPQLAHSVFLEIELGRE